MDDLGPLFPLGLGLAGHGALHQLWQQDILDLDQRDHHTPRLFRVLVNDVPQPLIDPVAMGQELIEVRLAQHTPQRGQGQLLGGQGVFLNLHDRAFWIHHVKVHHRVHVDGHVVPGDDLLGFQDHRSGAQVNLDQVVNPGQDQVEAWFSDTDELAKAEQHAALVLVHGLDGRDNEHPRQDRGRENDGQQTHELIHWVSSSKDCT